MDYNMTVLKVDETIAVLQVKFNVKQTSNYGCRLPNVL